jgi:hypothetical protein
MEMMIAISAVTEKRFQQPKLMEEKRQMDSIEGLMRLSSLEYDLR